MQLLDKVTTDIASVKQLFNLAIPSMNQNHTNPILRNWKMLGVTKILKIIHNINIAQVNENTFLGIIVHYY